MTAQELIPVAWGTLENIGPMQYQGNKLPIGSDMNCRVCHTMDMDFSAHHPNMLHKFRNRMERHV